MTVAAVMPLPEGMSELTIAGVLGRRRVPMICRAGDCPDFRGHRGEAVVDENGTVPFGPPGELPIYADADFCITGYLDPERLKPEGPFGDHLGYYSLAHDFPVMHVEHVYHRRDAIWPFTVVGRPPQEDSILGQLIHELAGPAILGHIPGIQAIHAVDAAGVHPLLLAIGSERYVPYDRRQPRELLTLANALLGYGQLSLAKYLWIVAAEDNPKLDVRNVADFLRHALERVDWQRDLHFQTCTTLDTLDYSSGRLGEGSKLVIAAAGPTVRSLLTMIDARLALPKELGFRRPRVILPGILVVEGPPYTGTGPFFGQKATSASTRSAENMDLSPSAAPRTPDSAVVRFCERLDRRSAINEFPLVVIVDQSDFASQTLDNFLWTTFTRSNPASDVYGIEPFVADKHWGCAGSLVIDARAKPHHAPPLIEDPAVACRVDALAAPGGLLHGVI